MASAPLTIAFLTVGATVTSEVVVDGGDAAVLLCMVTGDVWVGPNGRLSHAGPGPEQTGILSFDIGGAIDVSGRGFNGAAKAQSGVGPGAGRGGGGLSGGGAVKLKVGGIFTLDGAVLANGADANNVDAYPYGGAGVVAGMVSRRAAVQAVAVSPCPTTP